MIGTKATLTLSDDTSGGTGNVHSMKVITTNMVGLETETKEF